MTCPRCQCGEVAGETAHAMVAALADGDVDRALALGLLDIEACPACDDACAGRKS